MSRKKVNKPYWEMTTDELRAATKEFDKELVADRARPLTPQMRERWERAKAKRAHNECANREKTITVRLEAELLHRCLALAKKKRIGRDALIARGLETFLAAEGQT